MFTLTQTGTTTIKLLKTSTSKHQNNYVYKLWFTVEQPLIRKPSQTSGTQDRTVYFPYNYWNRFQYYNAQYICFTISINYLCLTVVEAVVGSKRVKTFYLSELDIFAIMDNNNFSNIASYSNTYCSCNLKALGYCILIFS